MIKMILGPMEIAFIVGIALLLLGPEKIPKFGKAIGDAMREYNQAFKGAKDIMNSPKQMTNQLMDAATNTASSKPSEDDNLIEQAKQLGIETEGKTVEQISREILDKF